VPVLLPRLLDRALGLLGLLDVLLRLGDEGHACLVLGGVRLRRRGELVVLGRHHTRRLCRTLREHECVELNIRGTLPGRTRREIEKAAPQLHAQVLPACSCGAGFSISRRARPDSVPRR